MMLEEDVQCVQQCTSMLRRVYRMLGPALPLRAKGVA